MRLLEQVCHTLRVKHYSLATERCYCHWILRFIYLARCDPAMLPCVNVPDLARFDWPVARVAGKYFARRRNNAGTALRLTRHRTGKTTCRRGQCGGHVRSGPACRFERPSGGTEEFLGRTAVGPRGKAAEQPISRPCQDEQRRARREA
jgi:hypothetical protein